MSDNTINVISNYGDKVEESKKLQNVDTNTYENIIYNKRDIAIKLFNELDNIILGINSNIKRNYLVKTVAYKLDKKIIEIQVKQDELLISFLKDAKQFDDQNKLSIRKGYENSSLCYFMIINNFEDLYYVKTISSNLYNYLTQPKEDKISKLFTKLLKQINSIDDSITTHTTNKGLMFRGGRNFTIISKKRYGIHIRLLNVDDNENVLKVVGRSNYEPLCRYFKLYDENDIDIIMPYINKSFEISKYNPKDLKNNFIELYYSE